MVIIIFRSRLRPEHAEEYERWAKKIHSLAGQMPGFVSIKTFAADDGERVWIVEFATEEALQAWRNQSDHRQAQELGRQLFYSEYHIQVCRPIRDYSFAKKTDESRNPV